MGGRRTDVFLFCLSSAATAKQSSPFSSAQLCVQSSCPSHHVNTFTYGRMWGRLTFFIVFSQISLLFFEAEKVETVSHICSLSFIKELRDDARRRLHRQNALDKPTVSWPWRPSTLSSVNSNRHSGLCRNLALQRWGFCSLFSLLEHKDQEVKIHDMSSQLLGHLNLRTPNVVVNSAWLKLIMAWCRVPLLRPGPLPWSTLKPL